MGFRVWNKSQPASWLPKPQGPTMAAPSSAMPAASRGANAPASFPPWKYLRWGGGEDGEKGGKSVLRAALLPRWNTAP